MKDIEWENQYFSEINDDSVFSNKSNDRQNDKNITIKSTDHYLVKSPLITRTHAQDEKIAADRSNNHPVSGAKYNSQKTIEKIHIVISNSPSERDAWGQMYYRYELYKTV